MSHDEAEPAILRHILKINGVKASHVESALPFLARHMRAGRVPFSVCALGDDGRPDNMDLAERVAILRERHPHAFGDAL